MNYGVLAEDWGAPPEEVKEDDFLKKEDDWSGTLESRTIKEVPKEGSGLSGSGSRRRNTPPTPGILRKTGVSMSLSLSMSGDHPSIKDDHPIPGGCLNHVNGLAKHEKASGLTKSLASLVEGYQLVERPYFEVGGEEECMEELMIQEDRASILIKDKYDITTSLLSVCQEDAQEDPDIPPSVSRNVNHSTGRATGCEEDIYVSRGEDEKEMLMSMSVCMSVCLMDRMRIIGPP